MSRRRFEAYVWLFYKPHGIYGDFFNHSLTREEVQDAVSKQVRLKSFEGDTVDREMVRDRMILNRLEYKSQILKEKVS